MRITCNFSGANYSVCLLETYPKSAFIEFYHGLRCLAVHCWRWNVRANILALPIESSMRINNQFNRKQIAHNAPRSEKINWPLKKHVVTRANFDRCSILVICSAR